MSNDFDYGFNFSNSNNHCNHTVSIVIIVAVIIGFFTILFSVSTSNSFVDMEEDINSQYANLQTNLQRRMDLIPNLVETVKGYTEHEEAVFSEIAEARLQLSNSIESGDMSKISTANDQLNNTLSKLLVIVESYPELKSSEHFTALMDEIAGTENRIAVSRQYYNEAVQKYNKAIRKFPTSIIASIGGLEAKDYFEADESAQSAPKIDFN